MVKPSIHTLPINDTGFLLWRLSNIWRKQINDAIAYLNLTHVQYLLLASIAQLEYKDKLTSQKSIAQYARIDIMMTSKVLRKQEQRKLVNRRKYNLDGRVYLSTLTKKGLALLQEVTPIIKKVDRNFFESVTQNKFSLQSIFSQTIEDQYHFN